MAFSGKLVSDQLEVEIAPGKGADITAFRDRLTGIDALFTTPWRRPTAVVSSTSNDSRVNWLTNYRGGWQVLIPNAGAEREHDGVTQGYHGEAAVLPWDVISHNPRSVELEVDLVTAPLRLHRCLTLDGASFTIEESVENLSPDATSFSWVHHPAFGAPFLDEDAYVLADAAFLITDASAPGRGMPPDAIVPFPRFQTPVGQVDLTAVPAPHSGVDRFGALMGFQKATATIVSPNAGFAIQLSWDKDVFPYAWFWQECHATPGFPWYRRAYAAAIEPANVLPGTGQVGDVTRGASRPLSGRKTITTTLRMERTELRGGTK